jgi:putative ABC transport system substrate-binding protein
VAAKAATAAIPIVFATGADPLKLGLVASLAPPGGNATGISFLTQEIDAKQLGFLHELMPKAVRIAVLVNPTNGPGTEGLLQSLSEAALALAVEIQVFKASTGREVESVFAALARERFEALFISPDSFFASRRAHLATLAARHVIATVMPTSREFVKAGGLMSYGTEVPEVWRLVGVYSGRILKGAKPADLPVMQPTKFELVINLQTARLLSIEVPPTLLAIADEVIE